MTLPLWDWALAVYARPKVEEALLDLQDVNEQNVQAVGFYRHMGFVVVGRSPTDDAGRPYPLLHMGQGGLLIERVNKYIGTN